MNNHPTEPLVEASWNMMTHAQKPDFVFRRNGRVHLNRRGVSSVDYWQPRCEHQLLLLVVMLDTPCSEVVWRVLATYSIRQFSLLFPSRASPCAITFQLESTTNVWGSQMKTRIQNGSAVIPDKLTRTVNLTGYDTHVTWTCGTVKPCSILTTKIRPCGQLAWLQFPCWQSVTQQLLFVHKTFRNPVCCCPCD